MERFIINVVMSYWQDVAVAVTVSLSLLSDLRLSYDTVDSSGTKFIIKGVKARGKVLNYQQPKVRKT